MALHFSYPIVMASLAVTLVFYAVVESNFFGYFRRRGAERKLPMIAAGLFGGSFLVSLLVLSAA